MGDGSPPWVVVGCRSDGMVCWVWKCQDVGPGEQTELIHAKP